jgi:hypothetical protein
MVFFSSTSVIVDRSLRQPQERTKSSLDIESYKTIEVLEEMEEKSF